MKLRCIPAVAGLLSCTYLSGYADDISNPIVVTATRTAETVDDTLASTTVITHEEIERQQAQSLLDVLRGVPGLQVDNSGGLGKVTDVYLRGTNADHVLVLIDGVKVGSTTLGTAPFENIPVDQIDHIEIVRGPRSSLYGSEAIGGVIQIFTSKGGGPMEPTVAVGVGSYGTYREEAGISGGGSATRYNLTASRLSSDGFNACVANLSAGCFADEPDNDGYRNTSLSMRAGYDFSTGIGVDVHLLRAQGHNQFDGTFVNESTFTDQVSGGSVRFSPMLPWSVTVLGGRNKDDTDNALNGVFRSRFNTRRDSLSIQNDVSVKQNQLVTVGMDYQNDHVESPTAYAVTSRDNRGVFIQYLGNFGKQNTQLSFRRDFNQQFGSVGTGNLAWSIKLYKDIRFEASLGTAFKAPTFNDLYFPGFGNPDLKPEKSRSIELSFHGHPQWGDWSFNVYQTLVDRLITFDPVTATPANIDAARIRGVETTASIHLMGCIVDINATLLKPENRGNGVDIGNILPRRAQTTFAIQVNKTIGGFYVGSSLYAQGNSYDDLDNTVPLGGYGLVDVHVGYALRKAWRLEGSVSNLLDKHYETAAFYNQPGRIVMMTLRYRPGLV